MSPSAGDLIALRIRLAEKTIYDPIAGISDLYFPIDLLEKRLRDALVGRTFVGPLRSRSKAVKEAVALALGYNPPASFRKTQPRFPGQNLDTYVQQSDNLQVWNEEVDPDRRYAIIRPNDAGEITAVRVILGSELAELDRTGTLTSKYQAKRKVGRVGSSLVSVNDTGNMESFTAGWQGAVPDHARTTADPPAFGKVLPIAEVYRRLLPLVGVELHSPGVTQERVRGEILQEVVATKLAIERYSNYGSWPDLRSQALEIKLQTSPTIDLGLVLPTSTAPAETLKGKLRHCDTRYCVIYAEPSAGKLTIHSVVLVTGEQFFDEFQRFEGKVVNKKLQLRLPQGFFDTERFA